MKIQLNDKNIKSMKKSRVKIISVKNNNNLGSINNSRSKVK